MKLSREKIAEKAEEIFFQQSLAEDGDPEAQNILGAKLASGNFVEKDEFGGLYWYCQALKKGYVNAKWNAGSMFLKGDGGVPKNTELAMMLIEEAAEEGDNGASHFLSECLGRDASGAAELVHALAQVPPGIRSLGHLLYLRAGGAIQISFQLIF